MTVRRLAEPGFTLIEALLAAALMAMILLALATVTAQWLPNWNRGLGRVQDIERLAIALDRMARDVAAAQFLPLRGDADAPAFEGSPLSVTFVRTAAGLNAGPGLEIVRFSERAEDGVLYGVRETRPYRPAAADAPLELSAPLALIRPPYRATYAFRDAQGQWRGEWSAAALPAAVRIAIRHGATDRPVLAADVALEIDAPVRCLAARPIEPCLAGIASREARP